MPLSRHRIRIMAWPVLAMLTAAAATGCQSQPAAADKPTASTPAGTASAGSEGDCPTTRASGRKAGLTTPPEGVSWQMFRGVAVPASPTLGPKRTAGDVARCYAHTSAGALLAACQIGVRFPLSTRWKAVVEEQTYGAGREGYIRARASREAEAGRPPSPASGELLQLAGFRFDSYSDQRAVMSLAYRQSGGTLIQASTAAVQWHGGSSGDWRYEIPRSPGPYQKLKSLKGYTLWDAQK